MSLSPKLDEQSPTIEQNSNTPSALAALLADSLQELESLRSELSAQRKRAEKAERLASSLQALQSATTTTTENGGSNNPTSPTPFPESATRILMDFEDRAVRAELARDEAEARKRVLMDTWGQLESYLAAVSEAAADARAGYTRIVLEGGGQLVLGQIPTLPGSASGSARHRSRPAGVLGTPVFPSPGLPPHAHAHAHAPSSGVPAAGNGSRRPRSPSMDGYHQPPNKKSRGDDRSGYLGDASHAFTYSHEYHYTDPHAPQHTYPPPPPPQHHAQQVIYRSQPYQAQAQPRMILPPQHSRHHRHHHRHRSPSPRTRSRSRSSSSDTSMSVDEMLLQATTDENGSSLPPPPPPHLNGSSSHRSSRRERNDPDTNTEPILSQQQLLQMYIPGSVKHYGGPIPQGGPTVIHHQMPHLPFDRSKYLSTRSSRNPKRAGSGFSEPPSVGVNGHANGSANGSLSANGSGEFQTHIFAPPVTGAPTKKSKFSEPPHPTPQTAGQPPPGTPFPPVNEQGQRICRQCGVAGRYKEGKCVEKWGPGPLGPGTVCDRCRKKMKRVERRGTLDVQQSTPQQGVGSSTSMPTPTPTRGGSYRPQIRPQKFLQRLNTMPATRAHSPASASSSVNHSHSNSTSHSETPKPPSPTANHTTAQNQSQQAYNTPPPPPKSITMRPPPSPPPAIEALKEDDNEIDMHIPTSEIGRGSEVAAMVRVNGSIVGGKGKGKIKSPLRVDAQEHEAADGGEGEDSVGEGVEDAEAEAEAEIEAELEGAVNGSGSGAGKRAASGGRSRDVPMEVDAEADLLEAVEAAAEANTNASKGEEA